MSTPAAVAPSTSPFEAAQHAIEHTRRMLFPFRFERWLALGLVAFLDQCGRFGTAGGHGGAPPGGWQEEAGSSLPPLSRLPDWVYDHLGLVVGVGMLVLVAVVALVALVLWLGSRGIFMYVDDVATGRSDVVRPWREHASLAASLFAWRFGIAGGALLAGLVLLGLGGFAVRLLTRGAFTTGVALLVTLLPLAAALVLGTTLLSVALRDFVAPIQLALRVPCEEALGRLGDLVQAHPGTFLVYLLLKVVLAVAIGIAVFFVGCATCCIGFLPVVAQALLQPVFFFERAWSLHLLRAMGYDLVSGASLAPAPATASA